MAEHTPGPWRAIGGYVYSDGSDYPVAEVGKYPIAENARFIASAPDLLEQRTTNCWPRLSR